MGCMVDMTEHTMMFTLNGEILLDDSGSELAFKDFDVGDGKYTASWVVFQVFGTVKHFVLMVLDPPSLRVSEQRFAAINHKGAKWLI